MRPLSTFPNNVQAEQEQQMAAMEADEDLEISNIADKQAGHTPHVAGMVYGRESTELDSSTITCCLWFRASSIDWHQFLGFPAQLGGPVLGKRANPWEEQARDHQEQRRQQLATMDMEQALQQMTQRQRCGFAVSRHQL
jgi:hypothetical protein